MSSFGKLNKKLKLSNILPDVAYKNIDEKQVHFVGVFEEAFVCLNKLALKINT